MQHPKKLYETTFIVNASLEDNQIETVINHVQEVITRNGGEVLALNKWGRKRLAYTIQKKNNGFYTNIEMKAPGVVMSQLERAYQLDENILRFLTIQMDHRAIKARQLSQIPQTEPSEQTPPPAPQREVAPPPKEPLFANDADDASREKAS